MMVGYSYSGMADDPLAAYFAQGQLATSVKPMKAYPLIPNNLRPCPPVLGHILQQSDQAVVRLA